MDVKTEIQLIQAILTFLHRDTKLVPAEIETFQACVQWLNTKGTEMSNLAKQLEDITPEPPKKKAAKKSAK